MPHKKERFAEKNRWAKNLSQRLRRSFKKFREKYQTQSNNYYGFNFYQIARLIGECPGKNPRRWNIDHVIPISAFNFEKESHVIYCWSKINLRWVPKTFNSLKSNSLSVAPEEILDSLCPYDRLQLKESTKMNYESLSMSTDTEAYVDGYMAYQAYSENKKEEEYPENPYKQCTNESTSWESGLKESLEDNK